MLSSNGFLQIQSSRHSNIGAVMTNYYMVDRGTANSNSFPREAHVGRGMCGMDERYVLTGPGYVNITHVASHHLLIRPLLPPRSHPAHPFRTSLTPLLPLRVARAPTLPPVVSHLASAWYATIADPRRHTPPPSPAQKRWPPSTPRASLPVATEDCRGL